jgi:hypothetical protein
MLYSNKKATKKDTKENRKKLFYLFSCIIKKMLYSNKKHPRNKQKKRSKTFTYSQ